VSRSGGVFLCLLSSCGFGALGVLGQLAYSANVGLVTLLAGRFTLAAALFWLLVAVVRPRLPGGRGALAGLLLGLVGYSLQAALFFAALRHLDPALADLLLFAYPGLVMLGAAALGRERLTARRLTALAVAAAGVALVLVGGGLGAIDAVGVALALAAAVAYSGYVLASDSILRHVEPLPLAALVTTGAALAFIAVGLAGGGLDGHVGAAGLLWIVAIALVCSVLALLSFLGGLRRVGPSTASVVSAAEPAVTAGLAFAVLGTRLGPVQVAGGGLVLAAVVVLESRWRPRLRLPVRVVRTA
jgi:drug/metabolite transporter (DMT)-like permease